ncbi:hypothetical protein C5S32_02345 [ANME-1 cluster archaeon GoMg1]|nr:hypothetical protein [ANME-1 cluster archaeon GoMg1]
MKIVTIEDIEGLETPEGIIKPLLFTDKVGLLYLELPARFDVTPHSHPQDNILYCIEGVVEVSSGDKTTTINADSVIFVPASELQASKILVMNLQGCCASQHHR